MNHKKFFTVNYVHHLRDWVFSRVHQSQLIYNTCWEDPRCDRQLLHFDADSSIVMITSAGCNALDYLLDDPGRIHCVDMNPRQNALLALKKALFAAGSYENLWQVFGKGNHPRFEALYQEQLREHLPDYARQFWDRNLSYFSDKGVRRSFYFFGTSGVFAWLLTQYLRTRPSLYAAAEALFSARSVEEQRTHYFAVEEKMLTQLVRWAVNRHFTMCLLGVPRSQQELFRHQYEEGVTGFIRRCFRQVFTQLPISDNYFYQVYFKGSYTPQCAPNYLVAENFDALRDRVSRIEQHNNTISGFLRENPGAYSHFILLDHQDWLAANNRPALAEEWALILQNSRPGTQILLRSAADEIDFFPDFVLAAVDFKKDEYADIHRQDRVGTYASTYVGTVKG